MERKDEQGIRISKRGQVQEQFDILEKEVEQITVLMTKIEERYIPITKSPPPTEQCPAETPVLVLLADRLNKITINLQHIEERMNGLLARCEL